jgi:hypothetical protein
LYFTKNMIKVNRSTLPRMMYTHYEKFLHRLPHSYLGVVAVEEEEAGMRSRAAAAEEEEAGMRAW